MTLQSSEIRSIHLAAPPCPDSTVLIVDDDEYFRALARTILEPAGFEVVEADGIAHCLTQAMSYSPDAILLDIVLPGRDGIESLGELKAAFPESKIITVSGAPDSELFLKVSAYLGADASLDKREVASLPAMLNVVLDR